MIFRTKIFVEMICGLIVPLLCHLVVASTTKDEQKSYLKNVMRWSQLNSDGPLFEYFSFDASRSEAELTCRKFGAHLAFIETRDENSFVRDLIDSATANANEESGGRRRFVWVHGVYRMEALLNRYCFTMLRGIVLKSSCDGGHPFVCKYDEITYEPSTTADPTLLLVKNRLGSAATLIRRHSLINENPTGNVDDVKTEQLNRVEHDEPVASTTSPTIAKTTRTTTAVPKQEESPSFFQRIQWALGRLFGSEKLSVEPETRNEEEKVEHFEADEFRKHLGPGPMDVVDEAEMEIPTDYLMTKFLPITHPTPLTSIGFTTTLSQTSIDENENDDDDEENGEMELDNAVVNLSEATSLNNTISSIQNMSDDLTKPEEFGSISNSINSTYYHIVVDSGDVSAPQNFFKTSVVNRQPNPHRGHFNFNGAHFAGSLTMVVIHNNNNDTSFIDEDDDDDIRMTSLIVNETSSSVSVAFAASARVVRVEHLLTAKVNCGNKKEPLMSVPLPLTSSVSSSTTVSSVICDATSSSEAAWLAVWCCVAWTVLSLPIVAYYSCRVIWRRVGRLYD